MRAHSSSLAWELGTPVSRAVSLERQRGEVTQDTTRSLVSLEERLSWPQSGREETQEVVEHLLRQLEEQGAVLGV
jgi:hypothetical protein